MELQAKQGKGRDEEKGRKELIPRSHLLVICNMISLGWIS
jgi:hypothetical protein